MEFTSRGEFPPSPSSLLSLISCFVGLGFPKPMLELNIGKKPDGQHKTSGELGIGSSGPNSRSILEIPGYTHKQEAEHQGHKV